MSKVLYPFQNDAVRFHLKAKYSLNCSEMGLGKTLMALETARNTGLDVAVIGPAFLERSWQEEAASFPGKLKYFPNSQLHKVKPKDLAPYQFFIADEINWAKNPTAKRTHKFYELLQKVKPEYFIGLTGTPIKNKAFDFWTLLGFIEICPSGNPGIKLDGELRKYHAFARHFCHVEKVRVKGFYINRYGAIKEDKIPEFKALLQGKMIRFKVEDVLKDLPEMVRKEVFATVEEIPGLEEEFNRYVSGSKSDPTAKKMSAVFKAPQTAIYCKELIEGGSGPLLIFTDHIDSAKLIRENLKGSLIITGATSMLERQEIVTQFQAGLHTAIVATIGALSVGVTLTAARNVIFNDLSWTPSDNLQAEARIRRIGQKSITFSHFMIGSPTDRYIQKTLLSKLDTISKVIG